MPRINVYTSDEENKKLEEFCKIWNVKSKEDVIKKMIREFPVMPKNEFDVDIKTETNLW